MNAAAGDRPLAGKTVLVTRPADRTRALALRLSALGARIDARPTLVVEPPINAEPARTAVARVECYDWVVLTSRNGVSFFHERLTERYGENATTPFSVVAIGPGTAAAIRAVGMEPDAVATESHSSGLARTLLDIVSKGERVLVVRPEVAGETVVRALRDAGAEVDAVPFYRSVPAPDTSGVALDVARGFYDAIVFSSPSSLNYLVDRGGEALERALPKLLRVAIGPTTADALESRKWPAHAVAETPDDEGIANAILRAFRIDVL